MTKHRYIVVDAETWQVVGSLSAEAFQDHAVPWQAPDWREPYILTVEDLPAYATALHNAHCRRMAAGG